MTRLIGAALLAAGLGLAPTGPSYAAAAESKPGECTDDSGITVVVDFSDLDGDVVVRCVRGPLPDDMSGLEALRAASFTVQGTARWGDAFVCRIQGRPAPDESLSFDGDDDYKERCQDTPPAQAYWGYWYADDGGDWKFSSESAAAREVSEGGFEGWAFSLDDEGGKGLPLYTPDRPNGSPTPSPTPSLDGEHHGGSGDGGGGSEPTKPPSATPTVMPTPSPSATATPRDRDRRPRPDDRERNATADRRDRPSDEPTGDEVVTGNLPEIEAAAADDALPTGSLVGAALLLGLAVTGGAVAWRRRRDQR